MKRKLLLITLCLLTICFFVMSCTSTPSESTEEHSDTTEKTNTDGTVETTDTGSDTKPSQTTDEPTDSTAETTQANTALTIPDDYYAFLGLPLECASIVIPAAYNEGIAYDIEPYITDSTVYFLLPSRADLSQVVYHLYDKKGNFTNGRVADFTDDTTLGKEVTIFGEEYPIVAYRSDSPTLYIEIDNSYGTIEDVREDMSKETRAYGTLLLECREDIAEKYGYETSYLSVENDADSPCTMFVKGRGNWTWTSNEKQGYSIKLEKKLGFLGMSKSKKWALIGNTPDNTMLRNPLATFLSQQANMAYSPEGEIVDVYINGEYYGAFLLSEKVTIDDDRLPITDLEEAIEELNPTEDYGKQRVSYIRSLGITLKYWSDVPDPEDITGGYIIEMEMQDRYGNEASGFTTRQGFYYVIKSPEYASYEQVKYIATLVQEAEDALFSKNGINPTTGKSISDYYDIDTLLKKYWIDEIAKNRDGAKTSHYTFKPTDSQSTKLYLGPVWDYDIAFGISAETVDPEGWFSREEKKFYEACFRHEEIEARAKELFFEIFYPAVNQFIEVEADLWVEKIEASMQMNYVVWDQLDKDYSDYVKDLKNYLQKRIYWIYREIS